MATTPPPSPHPLGADAPTQDYVGLAMAAMGLAIMAGTAVISVVTWTVRTVQAYQPPPPPGELGLAGTVLLGGTMVGLLVSAAIVWTALTPVRSPYRQGGLAMATVFATILVSFIATFVADNFLGRTGLLILTALASVLAWMATRAVARERAALT
ncbi:MAG TPA: hypothetical protein VMK53_00230 [Gemmatimonadales bacterium]|nr:hypothetical protein [Gemmatimonadales bacterium]